jgi:hypothetical protein
MPRVPAGWHVAAGSQAARTGVRARRIPVTGQARYWHLVDVELHASTLPATVTPAGTAVGMVGPAGTGERWDVTLVQVFTTSGLAVPAVAQIWRAVAGQTVNLLMQTGYGGSDDLSIAGPGTISAGEQIMVTWSKANPGDQAWAVLRGTKYVLEAS